MDEKAEKKAYDLKDLSEKLKARGLDMAEEACLILVDEMAAWVVESAAISATPFDDVLAVVMPTLKKEAAKYIDKIDGQVG